jgi:chromate transporter
MNKKMTLQPEIPFKEAVFVWIKVAVNSFGGPAGQIAVMHRILVEEKKWISEEKFLHALNYCMLLPGPEAQQLATYIGWLLHKFKGGITAGTMFVIPGFMSILALSILYSSYQDTTFITALFFGLKAAVLAIVIDAVIRIGRRALKNVLMYLIAAGAFVAIFFFNVPFPLIIIFAGFLGFLLSFLPKEIEKIPDDEKGSSGSKPTMRYLVKVFLIFGGLWIAPLSILLIFTSAGNVFTQEGVFFSKAAVVTFGGAYAVLAYISQEAVQTYGWLQPGEMLDGLGMAETTPGPLIQVVQFVGYMGAFRLAAGMDPVTAGILASILVTWVTFMPSFLWIFLGAPFMENLRKVIWLNSALTGITAAVVGVILNLALWFFIHTIFISVDTEYYGVIRLYLPEWGSMNPAALILALASLTALLKFKLNVMVIIPASAILGMIIYFLL